MPATIPGSSPAPDVSATVPTKHIQKVGQRTVDTSQDSLFHTLSNIQLLLKAKQRNTLKSSKITTYFRSMETKEKEAANTNTNEREVILVD